MDDRAIRIIFTGDLMLSPEFLARNPSAAQDPRRLFQRLEPIFDRADAIVVNLEGPLGRSPQERADTQSLLSNDSAVLRLFEQRPATVFNLANNHMLDYGPPALKETIERLQASGFAHVGAGPDAESAQRSLILEIKGRRIAFLAATTSESHVNAVIAGDDSAGCGSLEDESGLTRKVRRLSRECDLVCAMLHWGFEHYHFPSPQQVSLGHSLVQAGAGLIVGHHPHAVQGIESGSGWLAAYSLGNFFLPPFLYKSGRRSWQKREGREFLLLEAKIESGGLGFEALAGEACSDRGLRLYEGSSKARFERRLQRLSHPLGRPDYSDFWRRYRSRRRKQLKRQELLEAWRKARRLSPRDLLRTASKEDLKRQFKRVAAMIRGG